MSEPACIKCERKPDEIDEYVSAAKEQGVDPDLYVLLEEGTYNIETKKFVCTKCYVQMGQPSSPKGWKAGDPLPHEENDNPLLAALNKAAYVDGEFDPAGELGVTDAQFFEMLIEITTTTLSDIKRKGEKLDHEALMFLVAAGFMTGVEFQKEQDK